MCALTPDMPKEDVPWRLEGRNAAAGAVCRGRSTSRPCCFCQSPMAAETYGLTFLWSHNQTNQYWLIQIMHGQCDLPSLGQTKGLTR